MICVLRLGILAAAIAGIVAATSALNACQICVPFPKKSAADYLLEAEAVVLAREDLDRPFHFVAIDVLEGEPGETPIELFLDSTTRRILATNPDRSVVLVKTTVAGTPQWKRIGMANAAFAPLVREILASADTWEAEPRARVDFFGKLLGHDDPQISTLAHLEIGSAPYSEIKRVAASRPLSREEIHAFLKNFRYVEWHPLYILLLAQDPQPEDREWILESFRSAMRFGTTTRLAAWTTAAIELDGDKALGFIDAQLPGDSGRGRSEGELAEIARALSVHGNGGRIELRDAIVAGYATLLDRQPSLAPQLVTDLISWKRSELADTVARIAARKDLGFDFNTLLRLRRYAKSGAGL